jgi:hypothetical protein
VIEQLPDTLERLPSNESKGRIAKMEKILDTPENELEKK